MKIIIELDIEIEMYRIEYEYIDSCLPMVNNIEEDYQLYDTLENAKIGLQHLMKEQVDYNLENKSIQELKFNETCLEMTYQDDCVSRYTIRKIGN